MTAFEHRYYKLDCDGDRFRCREKFQGELDETRAAVRRRAEKSGWTHVAGSRRNWGNDYCPAHKPAEEAHSD